jgi:peptide/nickel transport system permease protein
VKRVLAATGRSWSGRMGLALVSIMVVAVVVSYIWVPYDPLRPYPSDDWLPMSWDHLFGTDAGGADLFSQVLVGARVSLYVALASALIAGVIGVVLAVVSAITPRYLGEPIAHFIDVMIAIPTLVLAIVLVGLFHASLITVALALGFGSGVVLGRILRAECHRVLTQDYIVAAHASGTSTLRTVRRHVLPNIAPVAIVQLSLIAALSILAEASLSYLGLTSRTRPSWGLTLSGLQATITVHPWPVLLPGLALVLATLGFNLLGDGLRDATDPRLRTTADTARGRLTPPPPAVMLPPPSEAE